MPRQLSLSSAAQAAFAAVLVIGVLLLLIVSGQNNDDREQDRATAADQEDAPRELAAGFTTVPEDQFFATITKAQQESGGWHQAMAVDEDDQTVTLLSQDVWMDAAEPVMRGTSQGPTGPLTALYADGAVYLRGIDGQAKTWWQVPNRSEFASLLALAEQDLFLDEVKDLQEFEVKGVEKIDTVAQDGSSSRMNAVHYTIEVDALTDDGRGGTTVQPVTMNFWLDEQDRPVQAVTTYTLGGVETRTTLLYSQYGQIAPIKAPPASEVTSKVPAGYEASRQG